MIARSLWPLFVAGGLAVMVLPEDRLQAVVVSDSPDKHETTPGGEVHSLNLDGVGLIGGDLPDSAVIEDLIPQCTASLISNEFVLSAAHCFDRDLDGQVDSLWRFPSAVGFETTSGDVLIRLKAVSIQFPGAWPANQHADLAVIQLQASAPGEIPRYPLYGTADEVGQRIVIAGYGATGLGRTGAEEAINPVKRVGLNRYEDVRQSDLLVYDFDSGQPMHNALKAVGRSSDLGFGRDEVMSAPGDSGGPVFIGNAIAGIISFGDRADVEPNPDVDDQINSSWGELDFSVRVSAHREFLTAATNGQAVFVPEPTVWHLIVIGVLLTPLARQSRK